MYPADYRCESWIGWVGSNAVGIALYAGLTSPLREPYAMNGPGAGVLFLFVLAPVLLIFFLLNSTIMLRALWSASRRKRFAATAAMIWILLCLAWFCAIGWGLRWGRNATESVAKGPDATLSLSGSATLRAQAQRVRTHVLLMNGEQGELY